MSANNYVAVQEMDDGTWDVWVKDADTGLGYPEHKGLTKAEAIEKAAEIDWTEYGISVVSKAKK